MKKIFSFVAVLAVLAVGFSSCKKDKEKEPEPQPTVETVTIKISDYVRWLDATAVEGWWQIMGQDEGYYVTLSNTGSVEKAAGTYAVADLDPKYSFISVFSATDTTKVALKEGSVTITVEGENAKAAGKITGEDGKIYDITLEFTAPVAEHEAVLEYEEGQLGDYTASDGVMQIQAMAPDYSSMVQLVIYTDQVVGTYTQDDLDPNYSAIVTADGLLDIYSAEVDVQAQTEGGYIVYAHLLCYDNTMYNVTITIPAAEGGEEVEPLPARRVAEKRIRRF